jgi:methionyl-tRNA formyltransferase
MKIAFCTCVQLGKSCIEEVLRIGGRFDLFITLKDEQARQKSGRIYLDELAAKENTPLLKIRHINDPEVLDALKEYEIDWLFIIGWSQIAGAQVLAAPKQGIIGMHPTLLPLGRGRAAIPWAILKGLPETGVTMFKMDAGVDTGDILAQGRIALHDQITATELYGLVDEMHVKLMGQCWKDLVEGTLTAVPQDHSKATEWPGRNPEDGQITSAMTMVEAHRMVRAVTHPYPGAFYRTEEGTIRIWSARVSPDEKGLPLKDGFLIPVDFEREE